MEKEQGFSAVESLIAMAITIILMAGTMETFNRSVGLNEKATQLSDVEQNMRAGLNLMVSDFISAGWSIPIGGVPLPSGAGSVAVKRPGPPESNLTWPTPSISAVNAGQALGPDWNGQPTDLVNILFADNLLPMNQRDLVSINGDGTQVEVDAETPITGTGVNYPVTRGDFILLSNANGTALQCVTNVSGQIISFGAGDDMHLNQPTAVYGSVRAIRNTDDDGNPTDFPPTYATRVWLISYYLDNTTVPETPRLMRQVNFNEAKAVALVLENLQLAYDLVDGDTDPDNDPQNQKSPANLAQIRKVHIQLSGRSGTPIRETGEYIRRGLTTQVSLRSLAYFDRYPEGGE